MKKILLFATLLGVAAALNASAADAQTNWDHNCAKCHGADGKGHTKIGERLGIKDFSDPKVQSSFTDEQAVNAVKNGIKEDGRLKMKPIEGLSDQEIKALVAHVRGFKS